MTLAPAVVDTRMAFGTRWLLGGGNKQRGLRTLRLAADAESEFMNAQMEGLR